ncbi:MAG TPA: N-acyl homoserine lactonase family protein [Thermoleophilaceae bacterium]
MSTGAEPQPASLPLPGGREGATVKLYPLLSGVCKGPPAWFHREEGRIGALHAFGVRVPRAQLIDVPVVAFLVEHPEFGPFLIDTGFHASVAVDPKQNLGRLNAAFFKDIEMAQSDAISHQLRSRGIEPGRVKLVVMTHLHVDHASAIVDFPSATFLVSRREWAAAVEPRGAPRGYIRRQFDHAFDYRLVDFDSSAADSFATFGRSFDVFGDGSVRLVSTPGHTFGHLSVVLRLQGREALVAGDAIYSLRTMREGHLPYRVADEHLFRRSLREIQHYAEQTPDAVIIPGHDMGAWRTLERVY